MNPGLIVKPPKRTAMKRSYIKRKPARYPPAALIRQRKAWEKMQRGCHICGRRGMCETHHIALRSQAPGRFEHPANWLFVCRPCHAWLHETGDSRHHELLECKRIADPSNYDVAAWLELAGKPKSYLD